MIWTNKTKDTTLRWMNLSGEKKGEKKNIKRNKTRNGMIKKNRNNNRRNRQSQHIRRTLNKIEGRKWRETEIYTSKMPTTVRSLRTYSFVLYHLTKHFIFPVCIKLTRALFICYCYGCYCFCFCFCFSLLEASLLI